MKHDDYATERIGRDPEFRAALKRLAARRWIITLANGRRHIVHGLRAHYRRFGPVATRQGGR